MAATTKNKKKAARPIKKIKAAKDKKKKAVKVPAPVQKEKPPVKKPEAGPNRDKIKKETEDILKQEDALEVSVDRRRRKRDRDDEEGEDQNESAQTLDKT